MQNTKPIKIHGSGRLRLRRDVTSWVIMLPSIILFAFFVWTPLLESVRMSFYNAQGIRLTEFVGFENYIRLFKHPNFQPAMINTFKYIFWSLLIGFWIPIIMASLITETVHWKGFFRVGVYFPNILPGLASVILWGFLFRPGETGVLNIILGWFGVEPRLWLTNPNWTIPLIVMTMTWKAAGSTALVYMAAIAGVDTELYEAAAIDGARPLKRFRHITLPSIFRLGKTLLIMQIIAVFQILYEPLVMTNGGPNNASISIMQQVYKYAFEDFNYPMAAALSVIICIILALLTIVYFRATKSKDD